MCVCMWKTEGYDFIEFKISNSIRFQQFSADLSPEAGRINITNVVCSIMIIIIITIIIINRIVIIIIIISSSSMCYY